MDVLELFARTLAPLPWPATQPPGDSQAPTYLTFNETSWTDAEGASNAARRVHHLVQLHAITTGSDGEHREALRQAIALLKAVGVRVYAGGPDIYETDTRRHHVACTCEYWEKIT